MATVSTFWRLAIALLATVCFAPSPSIAAESIPPEIEAAVQAVLDEDRDALIAASADDGEDPEVVATQLPRTLTNSFMFTPIDLNRDGVSDWRINFYRTTAGFCGTGGCLNQIYVSRPGGGHDLVFSRQVRQIVMTPATDDQNGILTLDLHGTACGGTGNMPCPVAYRWNEQARALLPISLPETSSRVPVLPSIVAPGSIPVPAAITASLSRYTALCRKERLPAPVVSADRVPDLDGDGRADWVTGSGALCGEEPTRAPMPITVWLDRADGPLRTVDCDEGMLQFDVSGSLPVLVAGDRDGTDVGLDDVCKATAFRWNADRGAFVAYDASPPQPDELALLEADEAMFSTGLPSGVSDEQLASAIARVNAYLKDRSPTDLFLARARLVEGVFRIVRGASGAEELLRRARETFGLEGDAALDRYRLASLFLARAITAPERSGDRQEAAMTAIHRFDEETPIEGWLTVRGYELYIDTLFRQDYADIDVSQLARVLAAGAGTSADSWISLHRIQYYAGALARAEMRWSDALEIDQQVLDETLAGPSPDDVTVAEERGRVALDLVNLARFDEAAGVSQAALEALEVRYGAADRRTLRAASATGDILARAGRLSQSEALLRSTAAKIAALDTPGYDLPIVLQRSGETALILGRLDEGRGLLTQAREFERQLVDREIFTERYDRLATTRALGRVLALTGDVDGARALYAEALGLTDFNDRIPPSRIAFLLDVIEVAPPIDPDGLALLAAMVDASEASLVAIAAKAVSFARQSLPEGHPEIVRALRILARAQINAGAPERMDAAEEALAASVPLPGDGISAGLEVRTDMVQLLIADPASDLDRATMLAQQALAIARDRRARLRSGGGTALDPELKRGFLAPVLVASALQERGLAVPDDQLDQAFQGLQDAEVSQAGIATARAYLARSTAGTPDAALLAQFTAAEERARSLDRLYVAALLGGDVAGSERLQQLASAAQAEADSHDAALRARLPAYAALAEQRPLTIAEVQHRLPRSAALVLTGSDDRDIAAFLVTRDGARLHTAGDYVTDFAQEVARVRCTIEPDRCPAEVQQALDSALDAQGWPMTDDRQAFDRAAGQRVYARVFAPLLGDLAKGTRLLVVQQGGMGRLPLAILPTNDPQDSDRFDPARMATVIWLSDLHPIEQLPSVATLGLQGGAAAAASTGKDAFIGYGNPALAGSEASARGLGQIFSGEADNALRMAIPSQLARLASLPGTQRELETMAGVLSAKASAIVTGRPASEGSIKRDQRLAGALVVAFATHGLLPNEIQGLAEPGLVFTPPAAASALDDGLLAASEVASLKLDAGLVILSACNTASTSGEPGADSLSALARSFLLSGAGSVLATRWSIPDDATAVLTVEALRAFRAGAATRAEALQTAMVAIRTGQRPDGSAISGWQPGWAHPQSWGGFIQIGSGEVEAAR